MTRKNLGHYQILGPLGAGGMGEVYRARDTKLKREVAIKVLPGEFSDDADRLARLEREAHLLAALNHPNIATIHSLEEADGTRFLVLELVKGESLEDRLSRGPLPVEEALDLCRQIARALEAAHGEGIIHRDLKPGNALLTPEGWVKVVDFGLAKPAEIVAPEGDLTRSPTVTVAGTQTGVILGTAPYMSPEQVRGHTADKRADIWAFGCVLYEMLVGKRAFERETVADTLAAIIEAEPDWSALPPATPRLVERLLRRCLKKHPSRRLHDIADGRIEIEEALERPEGAAEAMQTAVGGRARRLSVPIGGVAGALLGAAALGAALALVWTSSLSSSSSRQGLLGGFLPGGEPGTSPMERSPAQLPMQLPDGVRVRLANPGTLDFSRDGRLIAFSGLASDGSVRLYLWRLDELEPRPLRGTDGASGPFFSPDGDWLGFVADGVLKKVSVTGVDTDPLPICDAPGMRGASWGTDGTILFAANGFQGGIFRVSAEGGEAPERVSVPASAAGELLHNWPHFLPGDRAAVFVIYSALDESRRKIAWLSLEDGTYKELWTGGTYPRYVSTGHLVYSRLGALYAVPFDPERGLVTGEHKLVREDVAYAIGSGFAAFAAAEGSGSLV